MTDTIETATDADELTRDTVALTRELIRNGCVNDGTPDSGAEHRSVASLERFLHGAGAELEVVEPHPGRTSLVATVPGTDPDAPALLLLGHLDVVPVGDGWSRDPFGGELVDGVLWGRGALDMLHLTAAYASVLRRAARSPRRGRLILAAVADEESGGRYGAEWIVRNRPELVRADGVLSETGGIPLAVGGAVRGVTVTVGEKGITGRRVEVAGHPRHASTPYGADNAIVTAAGIVGRLAAAGDLLELDDLWPRYVAALDVSEELRAALVDPETIDEAIPLLGPLAGLAHALTRTTYSPDVIRGGDKLNVVPGRATIDVDVRTMPGTDAETVDAHLLEAAGPAADRVRIQPLGGTTPATRSPLDTPLYAALAEAVAAAHPGAEAVPVIAPGGADSRFFRRMGIPAYGFGMFSPRWTHAEFRHLVHSDDERIDVDSIHLAAHAVERVVGRVLG
ncbi:M20/M25/M40 family metallo-hydrolase [Pseudolysinimonas sp.]|uniref:M20/M25/M40 family metallo-hydrolase n=1 Tax=Pseudolysinimonas sp. TaxID=2680009 RepID=UPI003F80B65D